MSRQVRTFSPAQTDKTASVLNLPHEQTTEALKGKRNVFSGDPFSQSVVFFPVITTSELVKKSSISSLSFTFIFCFNAGRPKTKTILLNIFPEKCLFHLHTRKKKSLPYFGGKVLLFFPGFFSPHKEFLHFFSEKVKNLIFIHKKRRKKNRNHVKKSFSGQKL